MDAILSKANVTKSIVIVVALLIWPIAASAQVKVLMSGGIPWRIRATVAGIREDEWHQGYDRIGFVAGEWAANDRRPACTRRARRHGDPFQGRSCLS